MDGRIIQELQEELRESGRVCRMSISDVCDHFGTTVEPSGLRNEALMLWTISNTTKL